MRVTGNTSNWEFKVWQAGLYAETPPVIDHTVLGMALEGTGRRSAAILMTDCGDDLVPPGDDPVPAQHHADFIDAMAAMHAHFLGWHDDLGLQDLSRRWLFFAPETIAPELEAADVPGPIAVAHQGWGLLPERAPRLHDLVTRRCTATPTRSATRCGPRRSPSWRGTGSSATSATAPTAAPSCSTGPTRARRRRAGT